MSVRDDVQQLLTVAPGHRIDHIEALERIVLKLAGEIDHMLDNLDWHGITEESHR